MGRGLTGVHAAIAALAIACGLGIAGAAGASSAATEWFIDANGTQDTAWHPAQRPVQTGDKVTWRFQSGSFHNVRSTSSNWTFTSGDNTAATGPVSYTFDAPGTYTFECQFHAPAMVGTITVQDEPVDPDPTESPSPSPSPTPTPTPSTQPSGPTHPTTPAPGASTDTVKPTVRAVTTKALRRAVRVRFRLSEPATVTVKVKPRGSRKVLKSTRIQARAGLRSVTLRSKRLRRGRYTVEIAARDAAGNASKLAKKQLSLPR